MDKLEIKKIIFGNMTMEELLEYRRRLKKDMKEVDKVIDERIKKQIMEGQISIGGEGKCQK